MSRLTYEQLEAIKAQHGVDRIWSYSRWDSFMQYPWVYRMHYLEKVRSEGSIYTHWGTICHDIIQGFYDGEYTYDKMVKIFENKAVEWKRKGEYKFMSEKVEKSYIRNLHNYFKETEVIPYKVVNEVPIKIVMKDNKNEGKDIVFIGYADSVYTDGDGITYILDYKTSSKSGFSGAHLENEKSRQLKLYAIGLHQMRGIPYDKLRCRFDLQKYYEVWYHSTNAKGAKSITKSKQERCAWVGGMVKKLNKELSKRGYDPFEIDEIVERCVDSNSIKDLPESVQDKFELKNCYIDVAISEESANSLQELMVDVVNEIRQKELEDWDVVFPEPDIFGDRSNQFYFETLQQHLLPFAKKYQEAKSMVDGSASDEDLLALFN